MPVLYAKGEAEALCAQLNSEGYVHACITSDSDAFLFGAKCVIKSFCTNAKVSGLVNTVLPSLFPLFLKFSCVFLPTLRFKTYISCRKLLNATI